MSTLKQHHPPNPEAPSYTLNYIFEKDGLLNIGDYAYEGLVRERFKLPTP